MLERHDPLMFWTHGPAGTLRRSAPPTRRLLAALGAAVLLLAGCSARQVTLTERSGVEQQLLVRSLERAVGKLDLAQLTGRRAVLELFALTKDERFAREFMTARFEQRGVEIVKDRAQADVALKVFASVLGVDRGETFLGIPAVQIPVLTVPIPEIALFKWVRHRGAVEAQTFVYDARSGRFLGRMPDVVGRSKFDQFTLLLVVSFMRSDLDQREKEGLAPDQRR
jgi:hypothetical protein